MGLGHSQIRPWSLIIVWVLTAVAEGTALGKGIRTIPADRLEVPLCGLLSIPLWTKVSCHAGGLLWEEAYRDSTRCWHSCHINTDLKGDGCPFSGAMNPLYIPDGSEVVLRPIQAILSSPNLQLLGRGKQNVGPTGHPRKTEVQSWERTKLSSLPSACPNYGYGSGNPCMVDPLAWPALKGKHK